MVIDRAQIGQAGERAATKWLRSNGYLIHDLNWRDGRYELDIVAEKWGVMHFIEVKSRRAGGFTTPEEAMDSQKINAFKRATRSYIAQHAMQEDFQLDLVAVDLFDDGSTEIRLIERAVEFRW